MRTDRQAQRSYNHRVDREYVLTPGGIRHCLAHLRQLPLMHSYHAQSAEKGQSCVIEVTPFEAELFTAEPLGSAERGVWREGTVFFVVVTARVDLDLPGVFRYKGTAVRRPPLSSHEASSSGSREANQSD